ncbi:unnamed protein product [Wickerhamomyces anomalus]
MSLEELPPTEEEVVDHDDGSHKRKKRKKAIPWMKLANLPVEIIDLIFTYTGRIDYWTFRIFREFVRFRGYLDPIYIVQTNFEKQKHLLMFNIPPGQNNEDHLFKSSVKFVENIETHCELYKIEKKSCSYSWRWRIFLRAILFFDQDVPFSNHFRSSILTDEFLQGNELILDSHYTEELATSSRSRSKKYTGCTFFQYPEEIKLDSDGALPLVKYLDPSNVICKSTIRHLKAATIVSVPNVLNIIDRRFLLNLKTLHISHCSKAPKKTTFIHQNLPHLKSLVIKNCQTSKFNDNDLPSLEILVIEESERYREYEKSGTRALKFKMIGNNLPNLQKLDILTFHTEQIHLNSFGDKIHNFAFQTGLDEGGSLGDIPSIIAISESISIHVLNEDRSMAKTVFENVHKLDMTKHLSINDYYSENLDYLAGKRFKNLELLTLRDVNSSVKELKNFNMPRLKGLTLLETSIATVDIKGMGKLEQLIFTSKTRSTHSANDRDQSWRWFSSPKEYFGINFTKIPPRSKTKNVNLNFHKADCFKGRIPERIFNILF